jgi:hypothetical protein
MGKEVGWAEPEYLIGQPRIHKVAGFHYLYVEQKHVHEGQVGLHMGPLIGKMEDAHKLGFGEAEKPPLLVMFTDIPDEPRWYDIQAGYSVPQGTVPCGEAWVRAIEPALVASILVWGSLEAVVKGYGPLLEFMKANGYKDIVGWREWYLYWESEDSTNNITWVQHIAAEE